MPGKAPYELGQLEFRLGDAALEKAVSEAELVSALDSVGTLRLTLSLPYATLKEKNSGNLPKRCTVEWQHRTIFSGAITGLSFETPAKLHLTFSDPLFQLATREENLWFREKTLQQCLTDIAKPSGAAVKFQGSFSEKLPGIHSNGKSSLLFLQELADAYGFHYFFSAGENAVVFLKLGQSLSSKKISGKALTQLEIIGTSSAFYESAEIARLEPSTLAAEVTSLAGSRLTDDLGAFKSASSFKDRKSWPLASGKVSLRLAEGQDAETEEKRLAARLAKRSLSNASLKVGAMGPVALTGEKMSLSDAPHAPEAEGDYLVRQIRFQCTSAFPKFEMEAVHA